MIKALLFLLLASAPARAQVATSQHGSVDQSFSTMTLLQNGAKPNFFPNAPILMTGNINGYFQAVMQNLSNGNNASSDFVTTTDLGGNTSFYFDVGILSSRYSQAVFSAQASSAGFVETGDSELDIGADMNGATNGGGGNINFFTGGGAQGNIRATIMNGGAIVSHSSFTVDNSNGVSITTMSASGQIFVGGAATPSGGGSIIKSTSTTAATPALTLQDQAGAAILICYQGGGCAPRSRTLAQLQTDVPEAVGSHRWCTTCSPIKELVSTGTAAGNWSDLVGSQFK